MSAIRRMMMAAGRGGGIPYQEVEYLESSGTQYIDTGIIPDAGTGLECIAFGQTSDNLMIGLKDTSSGDTRWFIGNARNNAAEYGYYYGYGKTSAIVNVGQGVELRIRLNFLNSKSFDVSYIDGSNQHHLVLPTLPFTPQNQIRLFGSSGISASYTIWSGKIYAVIISQDTDIVMDLTPVRIGTTGYMYDRVSGQLFGNAGTGDFILGNDI